MATDYTIGHWRHKPKRGDLIGKDGAVITVPPPRRGLGDKFASENRELFKGCGCKKDVIPVINRWTVGKVTEAQIDRVAGSIVNKNEDVAREDLVKLIEEFLDDQN